jgi:hypothetical protein
MSFMTLPRPPRHNISTKSLDPDTLELQDILCSFILIQPGENIQSVFLRYEEG